MFAGKNEIWISADRRTKLAYSPGDGTLAVIVDDVTVHQWDTSGSNALQGFYGGAAGSKQSMTLAAGTALAAATISAANSAGVWGWASSTVAKAYVARMAQLQADLKTLTQKLETAGLITVAGN